MNDEGSTQTLGFLTAMLVLSGTFSFVAGFGLAPPPTATLAHATLRHDAHGMLDVLLRTPAPAPGADVDELPRFGLASPGSASRVDRDALRILAAGGLERSANDRLDYAELKTSLGTPRDFHLQARSVLPRWGQADWEALPLRAAYFGHYVGAVAPLEREVGASADASGLNVTVRLTNRAAFPAVAGANVALVGTTGKTLYSEERHTRLLLPGESQTVWARLPAMTTWPAGAKLVQVRLTDAFGNAATDASGVRIVTADIPVTLPTLDPAPYALHLQAESSYYVQGAPVVFEVDHADGKGARVSGAAARLVIVGPDGLERVNESVTLPKSKAHHHACANCTAVGNYTARALDAAGRVLALDSVHVSASRMFTEKRTLHAVASAEIGLLDALLADFDPARFDTATRPGGDVFGDDVNGPTELPSVLDRYQVVVIGSEASHHALSSAHVKNALTTWLHEGGRLVLLGAAQQPSRWLESEYHLSSVRADGAPVLAQAEHPLLHVPEALSVGSYPSPARAWRVGSTTSFDAAYRAGQTDGVLLGASRPGAFGEGDIVITSHTPGTIAASDPDEARRLLHNVFAYAEGIAFDYGPPIPHGVEVGSATRLILTEDGPTARARAVRLVLHVFG